MFFLQFSSVISQRGSRSNRFLYISGVLQQQSRFTSGTLALGEIRRDDDH